MNKDRLISADDFLDLFYVAAAGQDKAFVSTVEMVVDDTPTIDAEPVRRGCEYCSGRRTEYYHTTNTKLYINTFGNAQVLETECNPCPPYSNCSLRGIPVRSAFIINYCPNCGRKLDGGANDAAD